MRYERSIRKKMKWGATAGTFFEGGFGAQEVERKRVKWSPREPFSKVTGVGSVVGGEKDTGEWASRANLPCEWEGGGFASKLLRDF